MTTLQYQILKKTNCKLHKKLNDPNKFSDIKYNFLKQTHTQTHKAIIQFK